MSQAVIIKSNKYGIHLILDKDMPFRELLDAIIVKFKESEKFFKDARVGISFEGRRLSTEEEQKIIEAVTENTSIEILCVVDRDPEHEEQVRKQLEAYQASLQQPYADAGTQFYRGTLRSGQSIRSDSGIVVVGDVNPGATISASGSIVVLGAVKGNVYAGIGGDDSAFIAAMDLEPIQIGIGSVLAKSPDKTFGKKMFRKKPKESTGNFQIAYCREGTICIEPMTRESLNDI